MVISDLEHLEDITEGNLVEGGAGAQFVGSTSGTILGFSNGGGGTSVTSNSISQLLGTVPAFTVIFGTLTTGFTFPF